ncbi:class I SAM-dependent methyltransferase [Bradyrhizobium sp. 138]|uniref:class I SAM-dependent methyltransferase n=1 Tax=Bradyrhizobium sp. 138 TaxID=2782615 RepID=UPI001FFB068B|nr:class I SAM-dependent methyltransferase [Bradyrhizobium sp. 138]MCK1733491.1 class I SAM-dependent methyltransferase [Bradyrhizobium sp. 138]
MSHFVDAWNASYVRLENTLFYPSEGVVAFVNRNIRRRIGFDRFDREFASPPVVLDLGSGAGRHLRFLCENGYHPIGVELSSEACKQARALMSRSGLSDFEIHESDGGRVPLADASVDYAISAATFDSMTRLDAASSAAEVYRTLKPGGLFYVDLISDTSARSGQELAKGEFLIDEVHENGTVQLFYNKDNIDSVFAAFKLRSRRLHQVIDDRGNVISARWECVFEK